MSKTLDTLLQKEVTRKEFLQFAGVALISLLGFSNFLHLISKFAHSSHHTASTVESKGQHGFGSSRFGV